MRYLIVILFFTQLSISQTDINNTILKKNQLASKKIGEIEAGLKNLLILKKDEYSTIITDSVERNKLITNERNRQKEFENGIYKNLYNSNSTIIIDPFSGSDKIVEFEDFLFDLKARIKQYSVLRFLEIRSRYQSSSCNVFETTFVFKGSILSPPNYRNEVQVDVIKKYIFSIDEENEKIEYFLDEQYILDNRKQYPEYFIKDLNCNNIDDSKEDTDNDGIANNLDKCPFEFGIIEKDGCSRTLEDELAKANRQNDSIERLLNIEKNKNQRNEDKIDDLENQNKKNDQKIQQLEKEKLKNNTTYIPPSKPYDVALPPTKDYEIAKNTKTKPKKNSDFFKNFGLNISLGTGFMTHPEINRLYSDGSISDETSSYALRFDSSKGFPLETDLSIQYNFSKNKTLRGISVGAGYNTYTFIYYDENSFPNNSDLSIGRNNIGNTISYPSYVTLKAGLFYEFGDDIFYKYNRRRKNRFEAGLLQKYRALNWLNQNQPDFQFDDPSFLYLRLRFSIIYFNLEYPLDDFILPEFINQNSSFVPIVYSFGIEIPI